MRRWSSDYVLRWKLHCERKRGRRKRWHPKQENVDELWSECYLRGFDGASARHVLRSFWWLASALTELGMTVSYLHLDFDFIAANCARTINSIPICARPKFPRATHKSTFINRDLSYAWKSSLDHGQLMILLQCC